MLIKAAEFVTSAAKPTQYPPPVLPEIAFAGRSNVGKSSLINTLVNRKRLVKTSSTPGRTQLINFFRVNEAVMLVDLPGYGYAKVPEAVKRHWGPMVEAYLQRREGLKGVVLILDARRTPGSEELNFIAWLESYALPVVLTLTKADKLSKTQLAQRRQLIAQALARHPNDLVVFSAKTRQGRGDVWDAIERLLNAEPRQRP